MERLIIIGGPTASGKTKLAIEIANLLGDTEIISADSISVYRGFNIGAAKPSTIERAQCPHHLIDIRDPNEDFTAADFVRLATPIIQSLLDRQKYAIVVGGTGFYVRALLRGMADGASQEVMEHGSVKKSLEQRALLVGWQAMYKELIQKDPGSAGAIHPNDHYRIIRALQAMHFDSTPWSVQNKVALSRPLRFDNFIYFALEPEQSKLEDQIRIRSSLIVKNGILEETREILSKGAPKTCKPFSSVGYKECIDVILGKQPKQDLEKRIALSTRQLAKSQRTWYRGERLAKVVSSKEEILSFFGRNSD